MNRRTGELDGSVTIDSVLGEGTGVTVTLPA
jgi:signal transduction histidine kinase